MGVFSHYLRFQYLHEMKRSVVIREIPLESPDKFLKITLSYDEGGINYFTGQSSLRGYYVGTRVVKKQGLTETFDLLSGFRHMIEPSNRFSAKKLGLLVESVESNPILPRLVESTLIRSGDILKD
jgi:hypothetical protein